MNVRLNIKGLIVDQFPTFPGWERGVVAVEAVNVFRRLQLFMWEVKQVGAAVHWEVEDRD